ncbi:hypothetical protein SAMN02982929_04300 [Saccharopolyspora kobensis]|uniref:Small secreted domain DUF320 n=1 Tax=Saccharopolyspora kobensis TaxID=146035 RepID=A0A1H6DE39_9PSEU|nr:hypothetical protein [Saccharopolyspora kobensis]SEG83648.1 hypothetical protein SAMN02982929_04300 [Saccharopolyspora kobensis]SFE32702.1 hypothetical protein SAMN05216506_110217 [Saccharopolyspora kobensis]
MRKTACLAGAFVAGAGLLAGGVPAFADSADNDGINVGNDNNLSVLPVQLCGNNITVIGAVVSILSPQGNQCVNAPIVDHSHGDPTPPVEGAKPPVEGKTPPMENTPPPAENTPPPVQAVNPPAKVVDPVNRDLPTAPAPALVRGHHAVTG